MNKKITIKTGFLFLMAGLLWILVTHSAYAAPHALEHTTDEFLPDRVEPEGSGPIYDVTFNFLRGPIAEPYAALEGYGVGAAQWLSDPGRQDYEFAGWFDNPERTGTPYTKDTPIYADTTLYAKWKYTGPGGCWPRPHRGTIHGIEEGEALDPGQVVSVSTDGYNMHLGTPKDQRFRWVPVQWWISDTVNGRFADEMPFQMEFSIEKQGEYTLYITYKEEIFDGVNWQETNQVYGVEELHFLIEE